MDTDWEKWEPNMRATLVFVLRGEEVLLIHKKRGLGAGKINGPGGKIEQGETPVQAAVREVEEELRITPHNLEEMGELHFQFVDGLAIHCVVYTAAEFRGIPEETDEAVPEWFSLDDIPFQRMWEDDQYWLPGVLEGKKFTAYFDFDDETMLSKRIEWRP
jgi:8-oxo-dGTP diphosphatase